MRLRNRPIQELEGAVREHWPKIFIVLVMAGALLLTGYQAVLMTVMMAQHHGHIVDTDGVTTVLSEAIQHAGLPTPSVVSVVASQVDQQLFPVPANPTTADVANEIRMVFGPKDAPQAMKVAMCDSKDNPNYQDTTIGRTGVFGITPSRWSTTPYAHYDPKDAWWNIQAALWLYQHHNQSFKVWSKCS